MCALSYTRKRSSEVRIRYAILLEFIVELAVLVHPYPDSRLESHVSRFPYTNYVAPYIR